MRSQLLSEPFTELQRAHANISKRTPQKITLELNWKLQQNTSAETQIKQQQTIIKNPIGCC